MLGAGLRSVLGPTSTMDRSPQRPEHVDVIDSYRSAIALSPNKEIRQFYIDAIEALGGESSENWNETASCSSLALRGDDIFSSLSTSSDACDGRGNQGYNQGCISIRNSDGDAEDATNTVSFADEWDGQDESKTENRANVGGKPTGVPSVVERLSHIKEFLATVNEAERNDLLQQILAGLSDDDLRSVLQSMRRLPWETDKQVQTEIPDLTSQSRRKNNNDGVEGCDDAERNKDGCTIATDHLLRATRLHPGATRPLSIFIKLRGQSKGSKPKLIPVRQLKRTIAKIYEDKCAADLVDDREKNARSQMPNFVYDYHLKTYGVKSLAHKNLASLIASVFSYSDPDSKDHSGYDRRVHLFGRLAGILDPYDYQEHYCDFTIHFLPKLIGDPKAVDERMNAENPMYNAEQVATLLEDWFGRFNVPAPESVKRRVLEAGSANATNAVRKTVHRFPSSRNTQHLPYRAQ
eukprot:SAG31_NODE_2761_length_5132_cov_12.543016_3_plen_464_part_00